MKVALAWKGIEVEGITFDLLLASYIVNPQNSAHDLPGVATFYGIHDTS